MTSGLEGVRGLVEEIAHQKPEKPDYWNSCSQCERNIDAAQEALAALPTPPADSRGDVRGLVDYDAGLLNDFGGGDVNWWQDYLRAEIERANEFWREQTEQALAAEGVQAGEVEVVYQARWDSVGGKPWEDITLEQYDVLQSTEAVTRILYTAPQQPEARGVVDEAIKAALAELDALRGAMFKTYAAAANGAGMSTLLQLIEAERDAYENHYSQPRLQAALTEARNVR